MCVGRGGEGLSCLLPSGKIVLQLGMEVLAGLSVSFTGGQLIGPEGRKQY